MSPSRSLLHASLAALACASLAAACSSSDDAGDLPVIGTRPVPATTSVLPSTTPPTLSGPTGSGDGVGDQPEVLDLEVPTEVPCSGEEAEVTLTYRTANADQVAFLVDQQPVQGGPDPAVSGSYQVRVACDDNAHTILMAAVGPGGQAIASRAFRTVPAAG